MLRTRRQLYLCVLAVFLLIAFYLFETNLHVIEEKWTTYADGRKPLHDQDDGGPFYYEQNEIETPTPKATPIADSAPSLISSQAKAPASSAPTESASKASSTLVASVKSSQASQVETSSTAAATPSTPLPDKVVVMGKLEREDTNWVQENLKDWQHAIYTVDNPKAKGLTTPINKGREAQPYLKYLVDNYDNLPNTMAFLHSHKDGYPKAWHNEGTNHDAVWMLRSLNVEFVQINGYANLRCVHDPGCPAEVQPFRDPPEDHRTIEAAMPDAWQKLFNNTAVPKVLATPCCSQFAVSRTQVLKRPQSDYQRYLHWLVETPLDDDTSGRVWEYLWHIVFGHDAVYCPAYEKCICDVFGMC